jgi:hypothetical protein
VKQDANSSSSHSATPDKSKSHYRLLLIMTALSFIAMYVLMYSMVNAIGNAHPNLNQFYMAGLMAASMRRESVAERPAADSTQIDAAATEKLKALAAELMRDRS